MKKIVFLLTTLFMLPVTALRAQTTGEGERPALVVPWAAWASGGYGSRGVSFSVAVRREGLGLGFGYVRDFELDIPQFSTATPPANATVEKIYKVQALGADVYSFTSFTDWMALYATVGGYTDINTVLVTDSSATAYYQSSKNPEWANLRLSYGGGVEFYPFRSFLVGIGYHADRGFNLHVGAFF